jgi:hypothetical protein
MEGAENVSNFRRQGGYHSAPRLVSFIINWPFLNKTKLGGGK